MELSQQSFLLCTIVLYLLSYTTASGISENNCILSKSLSRVDRGQKIGLINHDFRSIIIDLMTTFNTINILPNKIDNRIIATTDLCMKYGLLYPTTDQTLVFSTEDYQLRDIFLIMDKDTNTMSHCIVDGIHVNNTACNVLIPTILTTYNVQTPANLPDSTTSDITFDPLHMGDFPTYVWGNKKIGDKNQAFWLQNQQSVNCLDHTYGQLLSLQNDIKSLISQLMKRIFKALAPLLQTTESDSKEVKLTNDKSFFDSWQNINHFPKLYRSLTENARFPQFVYDPNTLNKPSLEDFTYLHINILAGNVVARKKRNFFQYIF